MTTNFKKKDAGSLHYMKSSNLHPADTYFHFSFANYYDANRMNFGALRVLNDDDIVPHGGFDKHPHQNMEIVSYIVKGHLTHWDNVTDVEKELGRGNVQAISAGEGVWHSELNKRDEWCRFLQIWILPQSKDPEVRYNSKQYVLEERENKLLHIVGNPENKDDVALWINADTNLYVTEFTKATSEVTYQLKAGRQAYLQCFEGDISVKGMADLGEKDTLEIVGETTIIINPVNERAHFMLIEMSASV